MKKAINYNLINIAILLIIIFFLYQTRTLWLLVIEKILLVIEPFLIAFVIAYLFYPLVKILKKRISSIFATVIVLIIVIMTFVLLLKISLPILVKESLNLVRQISYFIKNADLSIGFLSLKNLLDNIYNDLSLSISNGFINIISSSISLLLRTIIILVLSICFLFNYEHIRNYIKKMVKDSKLYLCLKNIDEELSSYITGIGIVMLVEVVEYSLIYSLIGHPNFLLIAILAAITTIIPFFGSMFTNAIALITASVISKQLFILTALVIIILPIVDCYLIQPKIYKKTNHIHPIITIIVVIIGGILFGTLGIMIAVPMYLIMKNIIIVYRENNISII